MSDAEIMAALGARGRAGRRALLSRHLCLQQGRQRSHRAASRLRGDAAPARCGVDASAPPTRRCKSPDEALILASIVEKETGAAGRARRASPACSSIACSCGMPLQTDPTRDLRPRRRASTATCASATCWPTARTTPTRVPACRRRRSRCPVARRCWPRCGRSRTKALYFVSRGDGSSEFSDSLDAHNRAVNQYQRLR